MALDPTFEKQLRDWTTNYNNQLQGDASALARRGLSGADYYNQIDLTNKRLEDILSKIDRAGWGTNQSDLAQRAIRNDPIGVQQLNEAVAGKQQLDTQNQQLQSARDKFETQMFGGTGLSLQDALSSTAGDIGNLNKFLGGQEAQTFNTQLKPLIQMALGSQGLSDSGAQVELQSKALAGLEQSRQQSMMQAALGGRAQLQGLQRSDLLGGIGQAQQMMNNQFDLSRASITMQYQDQLENKRMQLAQQLSQHSGGGPSMMNQVLGGAGLAGSVLASPWTGGMSLMAAPQFMGMLSSQQPGQGAMYGAQGGSMLGQSFFQNQSGGGGMPRTGTVQHGQMGGWSPWSSSRGPGQYGGVPGSF